MYELDLERPEEAYAEERLDLSARTAGRLVRLARAEHRAPAVAGAFREGRITLLPFHHQRGVHAGRVRIQRRAPGALVFALGFGRSRSGDVRIGIA
jgi:hypothetical protein